MKKVVTFMLMFFAVFAVAKDIKESPMELRREKAKEFVYEFVYNRDLMDEELAGVEHKMYYAHLMDQLSQMVKEDHSLKDLFHKIRFIKETDGASVVLLYVGSQEVADWLASTDYIDAYMVTDKHRALDLEDEFFDPVAEEASEEFYTSGKMSCSPNSSGSCINYCFDTNGTPSADCLKFNTSGTWYGHGGDDTMVDKANSSWFRLFGGAGDDLLRGDGRDDVLAGDSGADTQYGNGGNDVLNGGSSNSGQDHLNGGSGYDSYRVWAGSYSNGANVYVYDQDEGGKLELHPATGWTWHVGPGSGHTRHGVWKHNGVTKVIVWNHAQYHGYYTGWRQRGNWDIVFAP